MEGVDADHRVDAGLLDGADMVHGVLHAVFQPFQGLFGGREIFLGDRFARRTGQGAGIDAMVLEAPDGGGEHRNVGDEAAEAAFDVPELLKADVGAEAGLGDVVVKELEADLVGDDGGLAHGDVGEGAGVHEAGLPSTVCMRVGLIEGSIQAIMALPTSKSPVVTGLPFLS